MVGEVQTDVVTITLLETDTKTTIRLNIAKIDHLLRRFERVSEPNSVILPTVAHNDPLDELDNNQEPIQEKPAQHVISISGYETTIKSIPEFDLLTFTIKIPPNAALREPFDLSGVRSRQKGNEMLKELLKKRGINPRHMKVFRP